jgi:hypothetical protein
MNAISSFLKGKSKGEVVFIIYRDIGEGNFLNRVARDKATDVSPNVDSANCAGDQIRLQGR